jgi:hypothetical protein
MPGGDDGQQRADEGRAPLADVPEQRASFPPLAHMLSIYL